LDNGKSNAFKVDEFDGDLPKGVEAVAAAGIAQYQLSAKDGRVRTMSS